MEAPKDYSGPSGVAVPFGYIDVTRLRDNGRSGIPGPDHPFYSMRDKIAKSLEEFLGIDMTRSTEIADRIMSRL